MIEWTAISVLIVVAIVIIATMDKGDPPNPWKGVLK
jgi:hypothetical protein